MKRLSDHRTMLLAAGVAAATAVAGAAPAQTADLSGIVEFEGGALVPKGHLEIYIDVPYGEDRDPHIAATTRVDSDGSSKALEFYVSPPALATRSSSTQIVARLENLDGWLLARGSAILQGSSPVRIILHTVMY